LTEDDAGGSPWVLFDRWFRQAVDTNEGAWFEPNAMTLATVSPSGLPSARIVLLKSFDDSGFVFYTNFSSQKGQELQSNANAALVFYWSWLERQVRVTGVCARLPREQALAYHHSRPRGSQLGALVSKQSSILRDRRAVEAQLEHFTQLHAAGPVPLPPDWGGFCLRPDGFEFWQGRENRLHDRLRFSRHGDHWRRVRLSP
jgi:pyridoxamine 5'-phosphate oxidase